MRRIFLPLLAAFMLIAGSVAAGAGTITYNFVGACNVDCVGNATATLVLNDTVEPGRFSLADFVSFDYSSSFISKHVDSSNVYFLSGAEFPETSGAGSLILYWDGPTWYFNTVSAPDGRWFLGYNNVSADAGLSYSWTLAAVPVPGPVVGAGLPGLMMALGGLLVWRRKRVSA